MCKNPIARSQPVWKKVCLLIGLLLVSKLYATADLSMASPYEESESPQTFPEDSARSFTEDLWNTEHQVRQSEAQMFIDLFKQGKEHQPRAKSLTKSQMLSPADQAILETLNKGIIKTHEIYKELTQEKNGDVFSGFKALAKNISQENIQFKFDDLQTEFEVKELVPAKGKKLAVLLFRVFHRPSGRTTLFVDKTIDSNSHAFRKYMSNLGLTTSTHAHSAENGEFIKSLDPSGFSKNWYKPTKYVDHIQNPKDILKPHKSSNAQRLKHALKLRKSAYVEFPPGTATLALLATTAQASLVIGSGFLEVYFGQSGEGITRSLSDIHISELSPAIFTMTGVSMGFGLSLGTIHRIQKNWQQKIGDSAFKKALKKSVISLPSRYIYYGLTYTIGGSFGTPGFGTAGNVYRQMFFSPNSYNPLASPDSAAGSMEGIQFHLFSNMMLSLFARNAFTDLPMLQQAMGKGKGIVSVKAFGKELAGFTVNDLYFSGIYLIPFTLSKADLLFHEKISVFGGNYEMGIGRILLLSSALVAGEGIYLMQKRMIHNAKKKHNETGLIIDKNKLDTLTEVHKKYLESQKSVVRNFIGKPAKFTAITAPRTIYRGANHCRLMLGI